MMYIIFSMDRPVDAELFNIETIGTEIPSDCVSAVLSRLKTDHLNPEELANLRNLCANYADVYYLEDESLTFTNKVKHRIRTNDEIPVHTKTY